MIFRWKLFCSYCLLALVMSAAFYVNANRFLEKRLIEESRQGLLTQARLAGIMLSQHTGGGLQGAAAQIAATSRSRVTILDTAGHVLADSGVTAEQLGELENHLSRPEVAAALQQESGESQRYSQTLKTDMLYLAMRCTVGSSPGIIRLALPLSHLDAAQSALHRILGMTAGGILVLALLFSLILSTIISRPLRTMADAAARFGIGDHSVRIPVTTDRETGYLAVVLNQMAERITEQMQRLQRDKERLDAILSGIGEGLIVLDQAGMIVLASPEFIRQFNLGGQPEGRLLVEVTRHPGIISAWNTITAAGEPLSREIYFEGTDTTLLSHWTPLASRGGQGTVAVFLDISATRRLETVRQDFLANVSHELRTPMAVIRGYAETLLDQNLLAADPEKGSRFIATIHAHTGRLTCLLDDILALSRLESSGAALKRIPLDLSELLKKVAGLYREQASSKGLSLDLDLPAAGLRRLPADPERIEQVLVNLLENALKYTSEGSIRIQAREVDDSVEVSVADTGIGIPHKDIGRIFERFYRVDAARSRELGGTGLGLSIVKHIVQLHGGTISVTSEPGIGSTFSFRITAV